MTCLCKPIYQSMSIKKDNDKNNKSTEAKMKHFKQNINEESRKRKYRSSLSYLATFFKLTITETKLQ